MTSKMNKDQPTHNTPQWSQQPYLPPRQHLPQPAQPDYPAVWDHLAQRPQQSHVQVPLVPQRTVSGVPQTAQPEQRALFHQQRQDHVPPPAAKSPPGYSQYYVREPVEFPQPQRPYETHLQPQRQQQLHNTLPQPTRSQPFDGPTYNRQSQYRTLPPQPQFQPPTPLSQNTGVYPSQNQYLGGENKSRGTNNIRLGPNKGGTIGNRGGTGGGSHGPGGDTMPGNKVGMTGRNRGGNYAGSSSGGRRGGQSGDSAHLHGSRGSFGKPESAQRSPRIVESGMGPASTQFQGAQGVNITGNPRFTNIGMNTSNMTTTVNNYGVTDSLEKLEKFVSFAALYDSAEQNPNCCCHPGTRENVLRQLRHWIDNPDSTHRIFWLHGPAGAGKSAIARTIADELEYNEGEVSATFVFYRSDPARNDGNRLFTTIAWQLAHSIPAAKDFIIDALYKTPHLPRKDIETQFEQLVARPMNNITVQMPQLTPVVIIDGVDECSNEQLQRRFLARPEALIEETLKRFKDFTVHVDLATLDDSDRDIEKYLIDQFSVIASNQDLNPSWPGQEIIREIVIKSSGNFMLASTLVRFIGDEDHSPVTQLDIVRRLRPHGTISPFALLDELYLEILGRQLDQEFLKTFLALLVVRSTINQDGLYEDDAMLMNVSTKELHIKLRKMRSLLKFKPFIDVYHKSFIDFLQDSTRSGQYHVSKRGGHKRYLELIVDSVVRHVALVIEQPDRHLLCRSDPQFKYIVRGYPAQIALPVKDWKETLKPLPVLQDTLFNISKPRPCRVIQIMRDLLLQLVILQRKSPAQALESKMNRAVTECSTALVTEPRKNIHKKDLNSCLSILLSCLRKSNMMLAADRALIGHVSSLLTFDHAETAARIRSVSDAQNLIDFIDLLTNNESLLSQCGPDARRRAAHLASEIFARVPVLPRALFLNGPCRNTTVDILELACQTALFSRILDHKYVVPLLEICVESQGLRFVHDDVNEHYEPLHGWLERSNPNFVTRIQVMLEVARTIRYIHSMDIGLCSTDIESGHLVLDPTLRAKVRSKGSFTWWLREASIYGHEFWVSFTYESNISAFADLFEKVCFGGDDENLSIDLVEDAWRLIRRCDGKDLKSQQTMEDVVKEMESWNLI